MFWSKLFDKKASTIATIWVENTAIYSVLEQVAWQESLNHCFNMGRKHCNLQCLGTNFLARKLEPLLQYGWKTLYSVLERFSWQESLNHCFNMGRKHCKLQCFGTFFWQESLNHCFNMGRKHCNLQCFGTILLARRLEPLFQHG